MSEPAPAAEFSRAVDIRQAQGRDMHLTASETERAALARRFDLVRVDNLEAKLFLTVRDRVVEATGTLSADYVQSCAVSAEDLPVSVEEPLAFRFVPTRQNHAPDEELEIDAEDCDEIDYAGSTIDLGEAVAQSLGLAIDPYATGSEAEEARARLRDEDAGPFAALKGLKPDA